jgi:hypothetical protein
MIGSRQRAATQQTRKDTDCEETVKIVKPDWPCGYPQATMRPAGNKERRFALSF